MPAAELSEKPSGAGAAAFLAAGIGSALMGLITVLAVVSEGVKNVLNLYDPAGPLSGKSTVAVLAWLVSWAVLHRLWKDEDVPVARVIRWTLILVAVGLLGTFPPVFEALE